MANGRGTPSSRWTKSTGSPSSVWYCGRRILLIIAPLLVMVKVTCLVDTCMVDSSPGNSEDFVTVSGEDGAVGVTFAPGVVPGRSCGAVPGEGGTFSASSCSEITCSGGGPWMTATKYPHPINTARDSTKASSKFFSKRKTSALF